MVTKATELELNAIGEGTLGRTRPDEPIFILCGRDRCAPKTIRQWVENARNMGCQNEEKLADAMQLAVTMERWQAENFGKVPD